VRIFRQSSRRRAAFADSRNVPNHLRTSTPQKVTDVDVLGEQYFHLDADRHSHLSSECPAEQERVVVVGVVEAERQQMAAAEVVGCGAGSSHHQRDVVTPAVHAVEVAEVEARRETDQHVDGHQQTSAAERRHAERLTCRRASLHLSHEKQTCRPHTYLERRDLTSHVFVRP